MGHGRTEMRPQEPFYPTAEDSIHQLPIWRIAKVVELSTEGDEIRFSTPSNTDVIIVRWWKSEEDSKGHTERYTALKIPYLKK